MMNQPDSLCPLVYSCSGCSNVAQLANQVAIELDREQVAEMSCIAGVGGSVKPIVKKRCLAGRSLRLMVVHFTVLNRLYSIILFARPIIIR